MNAVILIFLSTLVAILLHGSAYLAAYILTGASHVWSGRAVWAVFPQAHEVRHFVVYLVDVAPFFLISVLVINLFVTRFVRSRPNGVVVYVMISWGAALLATLAHFPFFPATGRTLLLFLLLATIYAGVFAFAAKLLSVLPLLRHLRPYPSVGGWSGALIAAAAALTYVVGFNAATISGLLPQEAETYRDYREPSPSSTIYVPSPNDHISEMFTPEVLALNGNMVRFLDIDQDGWTDAVTRSDDGRLAFWKNEKGEFREIEGYFAGTPDRLIHDFHFADFDNDGDVDLILSRFIPGKRGRLRALLKKSFWYPHDKDPISVGHLYERTDEGTWRDITEQAFPEGQPWAYLKIEPIIWFDANNDGLLDFAWQQYAHPRKNLNQLYIQGPKGIFRDQMDQFFDWDNIGIYPEGSDVADYDADGDIDFAGYGFLFENDNGIYRQICAEKMHGVFCDAYGRNDEGALFGDFNGDGVLDFVFSYHGAGAEIPKYHLQLFLGDPSSEHFFVRSEENGDKFYGFNSYARAVDYDYDGALDILTQTDGRILTLRDGLWVDYLPAITGRPSGSYDGFGWIDVDNDGDWDFVVRDAETRKMVLYRNNLNPDDFIVVRAKDRNGMDNQPGTTFRFKAPGETDVVRVYRHMAGYAGVQDPRIMLKLKRETVYTVNVCFPSTSMIDGEPSKFDGVRLEVIAHHGNCIDYLLEVNNDAGNLDLTFLSGGDGAVIRPVRSR